MAEIDSYGDAERGLWGLRRYRENYRLAIAERPWDDGSWTDPPNPAVRPPRHKNTAITRAPDTLKRLV